MKNTYSDILCPRSTRASRNSTGTQPKLARRRRESRRTAQRKLSVSDNRTNGTESKKNSNAKEESRLQKEGRSVRRLEKCVKKLVPKRSFNTTTKRG